MSASLARWILATYRANPPEMAQDESPTSALRAQMRELARRWTKRFDEAAPKMAAYFATEATKRASGSLERILSDSGMTVRFRMSRACNDAYQAVIQENVGLIRSIPEQLLTQVEGHVMRSVQLGRDAGSLARILEDQFSVARDRAALIARDQNEKATAVITRVRQQEIGIERAVWCHSTAGKHPRPSHVAFSEGRFGGPVYDVAKGVKLDGEIVWPGTAINCRCYSRSILPWN